MYSSILMPVRRTRLLKKYLKINSFRYANIRHAFSIRTEYDDVLKEMPPTIFEYPEQKIHVPEDTRTVLDIWKLEVQHYLKFIKNPKENRLIRDVPPQNYDLIVIGAGFMGTSAGYWLRERYRDAQSVLIIDKDLSVDHMAKKVKPEQISAALAFGNIRQQFSLKENIELARLSVNFFRNMGEHLSYVKDSFPSAPFKPFGFLTLAAAENEELVRDSHLLQASMNVSNELLTSFQLEKRFPWLNTEDIKIACHGLQDEGWIDPYLYLLTMRNAAISRGTMFLEAEAVEFVYQKETISPMPGYLNDTYRPCHELIMKLADGSYKKITFGTCILALGAETGKFCKEVLHLDERNPGLFGLEIPIERRKRYVFCFEAPEGGIEMSSPLIVDPTGLFIHRTGVTDYVCGLAPLPSEEPSTDNLDVDYDFFYKRIWPIMAHRIPALEQLRLKSGYAYYIDYNKFDKNGIVGRIPAYSNIFVAAGFGETAMQFSPVVGKTISELLYDDHCYTLPSIYEFSYKRILKNYELTERMSLS